MKLLTMKYLSNFFALVFMATTFTVMAQDANQVRYYELTLVKFTKAPSKLENGELELYLSQDGEPCSSSMCATRVAYTAKTIFRVEDNIVNFSDEELMSIPLKAAEVAVDLKSNTALSINFNEPIF